MRISSRNPSLPPYTGLHPTCLGAWKDRVAVSRTVQQIERFNDLRIPGLYSWPCIAYISGSQPVYTHIMSLMAGKSFPQAFWNDTYNQATKAGTPK